MDIQNYNTMILQQTGSGNYNGRINIIENSDPNAVFKMQERIALKNKSTNYASALSGNDWEDNMVSRVFFCSENIQILQNGLRAGVYAMSNNKIVIPPQNVDQLKIVMRSVYLQYAEHFPTNITAQIERLNKIVWDDITTRRSLTATDISFETKMKLATESIRKATSTQAKANLSAAFVTINRSLSDLVKDVFCVNGTFINVDDGYQAYFDINSFEIYNTTTAVFFDYTEEFKVYCGLPPAFFLAAQRIS
jgi:hypothetical protein